jgi:putative membrane protein
MTAAPAEEHEPDYRFTLANERTFLAWIRTSHALLIGGVALVQILPRFSVHGVRHVLSVLIVAGGGTLAGLAVRRWQRIQQAMRQGADLPASRVPFALGVAMVVVTIVLVVLLVLAPTDRG